MTNTTRAVLCLLLSGCDLLDEIEVSCPEEDTDGDTRETERPTEDPESPGEGDTTEPDPEQGPSAEIRIVGDDAQYLGLWAATADVDGDGRDEVLSSAGADWYIFDNVDENTTFRDATVISRGQTTYYDDLSLAALGDIDGDGYEDVVLGSATDDDGNRDVWLARGADLSESAALVEVATPLSPGWASPTFGRDAKALGDLNADGFDDFSIGATRTDDASGIAWLFFGGPEGPGEPSYLWADERYYYNIGGAKQITSGDFDGDGVLDLAVSSTYAAGTGAVSILIGDFEEPYPLGPGGYHVTGDHELFGWALASGDLDGDGYDDLAVASPAVDDQGRVYIVGGSGALDHLIDQRIEHSASSILPGEPDIDGLGRGGFFGDSIHIEDLNADGQLDLVVTAPETDAEEETYDCRGAVHIFPGGDGEPQPALRGEGYDALGLSSATADIDGDGHADLVLGAPLADAAEGSGNGQLLVYTGMRFGE